MFIVLKNEKKTIGKNLNLYLLTKKKKKKRRDTFVTSLNATQRARDHLTMTIIVIIFLLLFCHQTSFHFILLCDIEEYYIVKDFFCLSHNKGV